MSPANHIPRVDLSAIAYRSMLEHGLEPDYPPEEVRQVDAIAGPATEPDGAVRDLRHMPWCSIDNDDSRDLDQLTVAEPFSGNAARILVAVADVDALVPMGTAVDEHAQHNTTSVYTPTRIFAMLPERLSTDLTSLNEGADRIAMVVSYVVKADGTIGSSEIFRARVHNNAKLAYNSVAAWLDGKGAMPDAMARADGITGQIRVQERVAQQLSELRHEHGALVLETIEPKATVSDGVVVGLEVEPKNCAHELIEDFMIAANSVAARYLAGRGYPTFRRIVRSPERWDRIEALAASYGERLPPDPDAKALSQFLLKRRRADPLRFPDLSLTVIKLLGSGEYVVQRPGESGQGHFGLAVRDYSQSTAPNRRYPDIITQRMLKAALAGRPAPYTPDDLDGLAEHCTRQEDAAKKVERQMRKCVGALHLAARVGERFDAIVTGVSDKGTWVRVIRPPVEGKLVAGERGVDTGDRIAVKLVAVDVERGYIDFAFGGRDVRADSESS